MNYYNIKNYFLVFLGIENSDEKKIAISNLSKIGDCVEIMKDGYVLTVISNKPVNINEVRETAALGKNIVMVVRLESDLDASWRLKTEKSQFLDSIIKELNK